MSKLKEAAEFLQTLQEWRGTGDFSLEPIRNLMQELGNPQDKLNCFHIAGTNGKGSVSAGIASILGAAGYKVGLLTSPHLFTFNERIVIDGVKVDDSSLAEAALLVKAASEAIGQRISFFEGIFAIGIVTLINHGVDFGVIEVGLGGRLDATNVISKPVCAVITSIDLDHTHLLGDSLELIAAEKAGILKPDCPAVIGEMEKGALAVIRDKAVKVGVSKCFCYGDDFTSSRLSESLCSFHDEKLEFQFHPALNGEYQAHNLSLSIKACFEAGVSYEACKQGVEQVFWPARLERAKFNGRELVIDCAHNTAGVKALISFLESSSMRNVSLVFGALDTKNWKEMFELLEPYVAEYHLMTPDSVRAVPASTLVTLVPSSKPATIHNDCESLKGALGCSEQNSPIVLAGSMYLVGKLRHEFAAFEEVEGIDLDRPLWIRTDRT